MASPPPSPPDDSFAPFLASFHEGASLPEHHSALSLIQQLDHFWFWDNVFQLPCVPSCIPGPSPPPSPRSSLSPFRSIEMMQPLQSPGSDVASASTSQLPRARFDKLCRRRAVEREKEAAKQRSMQRRLRKEFEDMHIQVPRKHFGKGLMTDRPRPSEEAGELLSRTGFALSSVRDVEFRLGLVPSYVKEQQCQKIDTPRARKLDTISSGKQLCVCAKGTSESEFSQKRRSRRDRRKSSKSMTDLEFDELKGIMDLGFQFRKNDLTPRVVSMFPGLRRHFGEESEHRRSSTVTQYKDKPYLSEAWLIRRPDSPLLNWRMPASNEEGVDMKEKLKFWARAVASTVRQEC